MSSKKKILAICGSTKSSSTNLKLIKTLKEFSAAELDMEIFTGLAQLPQFNPDLDTENALTEIQNFRQLLKQCDGILICTPEYAMGIPGSLKNALDWTVSSMEFSRKPAALITASSMGQKGHAALLDVLKIIESNITEETQLLISFAQTKINAAGEITDADTKANVQKLLKDFIQLVNTN